ncbi:hypothetical protein EG329_004106 [Mollisiaceae sp. DMI_Dod_QoI]|nr:hypothetical protein EG329_004106 [Helotiales sp. DMI_Dod_QoI]
MDPLSGAASVIAVVTLAAQLADGLRKLVDFWKQVQKAPAEVSALFDDLENLSATLAEAELNHDERGLDPITDRILRDCQKRVFLLCNKISPSSRGLDSSSFKRRKWSAFRITLDKAEIEGLRRAIEKAETTLILVKVISIERSSISQFALQQKILQHISETLAVRPNPKTITCSASSNLDMQLLDGESRSCSQCSSHGLEIPHTNQPSDKSPQSFLPRASVIPRQASTRKKFQQIDGWSRNNQTPLGFLRAWSTTRQAEILDAGEFQASKEQDVVYALYPSWLLAKLGLSYGLLVQARCTDGWQYTIQPFNAVPDDALIFSFCTDGNVAAIKTLLMSGKASLRDRDSGGRTALWHATKSLQLDVVEFLLQQGADIHTSDWVTRCTPVSAIARSTEAPITRKISMLSLYQRYSLEDFDETSITTLIGLMLHFYRPGREARLCPLGVYEREAAVLKIVPLLLQIWQPSNEQLTSLIQDMFIFRYLPPLIHWALNTVENTLAEREQFSVIHTAIADKLPIRSIRTMKLLICKTSNLHRVWGPSPEYLTTPTSLAMYQPRLFFAWGKAIVEAGENIADFVRMELLEEKSPLAEEGWTLDSLAALFKIEPNPFSKSTFKEDDIQYKCERCGRYENSNLTMVDREWRRFLGHLRKELKVHSPIMKVTQSTSSTSSAIQLTTNGEVYYEPFVLESSIDRIVCSTECLDGVRVSWDYDNGKRNESTESTSSDEYFNECPTTRMPGAFVFE